MRRNLSDRSGRNGRGRRVLSVSESDAESQVSESATASAEGEDPNRERLESASSDSDTSVCRWRWSSRKAGFDVTGIDVSESKVDQRERAAIPISRTFRMPRLRAARGRAGKIRATTDFSVICRTRHGQHLRADAAAQNQRSGHELHRVGLPGDRQVLSSGHAGDSRIHHVSGHHRRTRAADAARRRTCKVGEDFFLCFSPERVDPGNPKYQTANIPKVVGGITPACTRNGRAVLLAGAGDGRAGQFDAASPRW